MRNFTFPAIGLIGGFIVGDIVTEPFRPYLIWKGAIFAVNQMKDKRYDDGYREATEEYSHTGYGINRANIRCASNGQMQFSDMTIDITGMDYGFKSNFGSCVDNSDRRL